METKGPWGTLQSFPVFIAAPDWILETFPLPSAVTAWTFRGLSSEEVAAVIDRPGLPEPAAAELLDESRWQVMDDVIRVLPSNPTVRSLPPDVRGAIYDVLSQWEENEFQHSPYYIPDNDARGWLAQTGLPEHLVDLVARTTYPVGKTSCFSDLPLLVAATSTYAEGRSLLKALSRTQTMILRVRLDKQTDVAKVRDYWSAGPANATDFLPLLESKGHFAKTAGHGFKSGCQILSIQAHGRRFVNSPRQPIIGDLDGSPGQKQGTHFLGCWFFICLAILGMQGVGCSKAEKGGHH
jgi:hypothetical protein